MAPERTRTVLEPTNAPSRTVRWFLPLLLLIAPLTGCRSMLGDFSLFQPRTPSLPAAPLANASKEEIVAHLNENVRKLRGWKSNKVKVTAEKTGYPSMGLSASIAVERPRNFRLRARSLLIGDAADFGSNDERFWLWMKDSPQKVVFHARHENVHLVQTRMNIPFDPDWLIESLGVIEFDPSQVSLHRTDPDGVVVDLFEERILANGQRAKLMTTYDTSRGVVVGRTLYDPRGGLVARATISEHRVHEPDGPEGGIVLPHAIRLEWPRADVTLVLDIGSISVNPPSDDTAYLMPQRPDCPPHALDGHVPRHALQERTLPPVRTAGLGDDDRGFRFEDELADGQPEEFDPAIFDDSRTDDGAFDPGFERGGDDGFGASPSRVPTMPVRGRIDDRREYPIGESTPIDIQPRRSPPRGAPRRTEFVPRGTTSTEFAPTESETDEFDAADFATPVRQGRTPPAEAWYDD